MNGVLILEDQPGRVGRKFEGTLFGYPASAELIRQSIGKGRDIGFGEVVFNTSMTGYQEILTDPSYFGQMVCMTYPHIGNTGINPEDMESKMPWCGALLIHELCETPSNWRSTQTLNDYLVASRVVGLQGIDTRALTRHLRSRGVVRGIILPAHEIDQAGTLLKEIPSFEGRDLIQEVTTSKTYSSKSIKSPARFKVVAMDFGIKGNLIHSLQEEGCDVEVVPAKTTAEEILALRPDGIFLSNGPGDPSALPYAVKTIQGLLGKIPLFGVCMGHQLLSIALGGRAYKLKFGHRGGNQPVQDQTTGKVEISSHNHGYAIDADSLPKSVKVSHINLNDRTVEGIEVPDMKAFSVQYHPEACPGPRDSHYLFRRFISIMEKR